MVGSSLQKCSYCLLNESVNSVIMPQLSVVNYDESHKDVKIRTTDLFKVHCSAPIMFDKLAASTVMSMKGKLRA